MLLICPERTQTRTRPSARRLALRLLPARDGRAHPSLQELPLIGLDTDVWRRYKTDGRIEFSMPVSSPALLCAPTHSGKGVRAKGSSRLGLAVGLVNKTEFRFRLCIARCANCGVTTAGRVRVQPVPGGVGRLQHLHADALGP
eukprot:6822157-Pyramimonas_sp.AAC.2